MPPIKKLHGPRPGTSAAQVDDFRQRLEVLRDQLTEQMLTAQPAYAAGIARQLQSVLDALHRLPPVDPDEGPLAALQASHAARLAAAGIAEMPSRVSAPIRRVDR